MVAEAAVHATRSFIESHCDNTVVLKIDFANAFNSIHRDEVLTAASEHLPSLFKYVHSSYGASSFLAFGDHLLLSKEGVQQGDPLGPLLFCLTILPIVKRLSSPLTLWYLNEGTLGGSPSQVLADFELIQSEGIHIGLQVNTNLTLLGALLGRQAMSTVLGKISELSSMGDRLSWISSHHALFLLKNCFTLPKLLYILRTAPCFAHPLLQSFDDLQIYLLRSLLNIRL